MSFQLFVIGIEIGGAEMKTKKKWMKILIVFVCFVFLLLCYNGYQHKRLQHCRIRLIDDYEIVGEVEDITLHGKEKVSLYDIIWDVDVVRYDHTNQLLETINNEEKNELQSCLSSLFDPYDIAIIEMEPNDVVKVEDDHLIPLKAGKTSAIVVIKTTFSDGIKTLPPEFSDQIEIVVED